MHLQTPLALAPPAGTAHWGRRILFDDRVLSAVTGLNLLFLRVVHDINAVRPGMPVLGLPSHLAMRLGCTAEVLEHMPRLPFALFDARFRDPAYWEAQARGASSVHDSGAIPPADPRLVDFARAGLTLAWHFSQVDARLARLAFGLDAGTDAVLASLPVGRLDGLARRVAPMLAARFCTRERFWLLFVAALRAPGDEPLAERVRLLGLQLQGSDAARTRRLHRRLRASAQA